MAMDRYSSGSPSWMSYFYSGTMAVILSWVVATTLSGCRFGNRIEREASTDGTTIEFFQAKPRAMRVCAYTQSPEDPSLIEKCIDKGTGFPSGLTSILSNPLGVYTEVSSPGLALLFNPDHPEKQVVVKFNEANGAINYSEATDSSGTFWMSPCTRQDSLHIYGRLERETDVTGTVFKGRTLSGKADLEVINILSLGEKCEEALKDLASCYLSAETCSADTPEDQEYWHQQARSFLSFWTENGALSGEEIADLKSLAYQVDFE